MRATSAQPRSRRCTPCRARGFSLLELMIALVILAIGVLGVIGLQMSTYKQLQTSHNFSTAAMLASQMADRMLANQDEVRAGSYTHDSPPADAPPDCTKNSCTNAELADYDVGSWQAEVLGVDPGDDSKKVPGSLPSASGEVFEEGGEYIIVVRWDDDLDGSSDDDCAALGDEADADDLDCYVINLGCLGVACP